MCNSPESLSEDALKFVKDTNNKLFLSAASAWELIIKTASKTINLPETPDKYIKSRRNRLGISSVEIRESDLGALLKLPELHKDPFDRLIIAQSISRSMPILSPDSLIFKYPVQVIW